MKGIAFIFFIALLIIHINGCSNGATEYEQGLIRYNDTWITQEEYDRIQSEKAIIPSQPTPPTQPTPKPLIKPVATFEPIIIEGTGFKKTSQPFEITTEEWIIEWSFQTDDPEYAEMAIVIYPRGETKRYVEILEFLSESTGSTYSYAGAGEYYAVILAANINAWTVTIKPPE